VTLLPGPFFCLTASRVPGPALWDVSLRQNRYSKDDCNRH